MSDPVSYELKCNICVITVNNSSVNGLSQAIRQGNFDCLNEVLNDEGQVELGYAEYADCQYIY